MTPLEFQDLWHQQTRVPKPLCENVSVKNNSCTDTEPDYTIYSAIIARTVN